MPDGLPVSREEIERHIAERGVTVCKPCEWVPPPTPADTKRMLKTLAEKEAKGELHETPGKHWKDRPFGFMGHGKNRPQNRPNQEKRARLRELAEQGLSATEIGKVLGVGGSSVSKMARAMGLELVRKGGGVDQEMRDTVRRLHAQGLTYSEIARRVGRTSKSVWMMHVRMGLEINRARDRE